MREREWKRTYEPDFGEEKFGKHGFSGNQRAWFKRVYENEAGITVCHFPIYTEERGWEYCGQSGKLQLHHVVPKGYCDRVLGIDPDNAFNGIYLCELHHVGTGYSGPMNWREDYVPVVHPDMIYARRHYKGKEKPTSYDKVFEARVTQTEHGDTYWNLDFDRMLLEVVEECVYRYIALHPEDKFPNKNKYAAPGEGFEPSEHTLPEPIPEEL